VPLGLCGNIECIMECIVRAYGNTPLQNSCLRVLCDSVADLIVERKGGEGETFEADAVEDEKRISIVGFVEVEKVKG
jgi:hypothetical protein